MRCNVKDSSALKSFVGLNDAQYVCLLQALFYFAGMRVLAPIKEIYRLRAKNIEQDYTSLSTRIVDMIRKTSKGKSEISRLIKVLVITIRPCELVLT
jgi:hypothetical protein